MNSTRRQYLHHLYRDVNLFQIGTHFISFKHVNNNNSDRGECKYDELQL